jgi:hypothetical protein
MNASDDILLTASQVRARYGGVSDMCLWRRLHDERMSFPQPLLINRRRYWRFSDLTQWEVTQAGRKVA